MNHIKMGFPKYHDFPVTIIKVIEWEKLQLLISTNLLIDLMVHQ